MTRDVATHRPAGRRGPVLTVTPDEAPPRVADEAVLRAIANAIDRLQQRYPTARPELVQRCVDDAFEGLRDARVTVYLPILIERGAQKHAAQRMVGQSLAPPPSAARVSG